MVIEAPPDNEICKTNENPGTYRLQGFTKKIQANLLQNPSTLEIPFISPIHCPFEIDENRTSFQIKFGGYQVSAITLKLICKKNQLYINWQSYDFDQSRYIEEDRIRLGL